MVEQLQKPHDQLVCSMIWSNRWQLFGKDEVARGSEWERQTLEDMQVENEVVLERLTRNLRNWAKDLTSILQNNWVSHFERWDFLLNTKRPKPKLFNGRCLGTCKPIADCVWILEYPSNCWSSKPMSSVFKVDFKVGRPYRYLYKFDADRPLVSVDPSLQKTHSVCPFGARSSYS